MPIRKKQHNRRLYFIVALIILGIFLGYGAAAKTLSLWPFQATTSREDAKDPNAIPQTKTTNPSPKNNNTDAKSDSQDSTQTSNNVPVSTGLTAQITDASESGQNIHFAATVANSPTAGTCVVTFDNPNDRPVTKQFDPTLKGTDAACQTDISAYEFSYLGTWQITFHYYLNGQQTTAQGTLNIK